MPILDQYERPNEAPPEEIGYEREDHDPDDRHPDEELNTWEGWELPEPEPTWKENIINNIL